MVEISRHGKHVHIEIKGWHKFWAFKSSLTIQAGNIENVYQSREELEGLGGLRVLGTSVPNVICAGNFLTPDGSVFCDFSNKDNTIIICLRNEYYRKLIVEVEDPAETIYFLAQC